APSAARHGRIAANLPSAMRMRWSVSTLPEAGSITRPAWTSIVWAAAAEAAHSAPIAMNSGKRDMRTPSLEWNQACHAKAPAQSTPEVAKVGSDMCAQARAYVREGAAVMAGLGQPATVDPRHRLRALPRVADPPRTQTQRDSPRARPRDQRGAARSGP